jgi:hypothetical protein
LQSRIHARMSDSISPARRAAAGIKRRHPRVSVFAACAAAAGVLGSAGFAVASAPWSQAAGDAAKTVQGGPRPAPGRAGATDFDAQVDSLRSAGTGGSTIAAAASDSAARQAARPAVDHPARPAPRHAPARHAAKPAPARHAAKPAPARHAPAGHAARPAPARHHAPAGPYHIWDSVTPSSLPAGHAAAVYANGAYAASPAQVAGHKTLLWIDTNGTNPGANVLDVEPGDATPAGAAAWAQQRLATHPGSVAIIYTMLSQWQQVKNHVAHLPRAQQANVRYWIADPTGVDHIVPGASATQWYWGQNTDISTATPTLTQANG